VEFNPNNTAAASRLNMYTYICVCMCSMYVLYKSPHDFRGLINMSKSAECFLKYKLKEEKINFTVLGFFPPVCTFLFSLHPRPLPPLVTAFTRLLFPPEMFTVIRVIKRARFYVSDCIAPRAFGRTKPPGVQDTESRGIISLLIIGRRL
jgi:hypothetical protein